MILRVEIVAELLAGEEPGLHSREEDLAGDGRVQCQVGVAQQISLDQLSGFSVVAVPGELDVTVAVEANAVAFLGVAEILGDLGPLAVFIVHVEEILCAAPLVNRPHGEPRLVIGGGERVSEPAVVLLGPFRFPKIEDGLETLDLRGRKPAPKKPVPNLVEEEFAIDLAGHVRSPPPKPREATTRRVGGDKSHVTRV